MPCFVSRHSAGPAAQSFISGSLDRRWPSGFAAEKGSGAIPAHSMNAPQVHLVPQPVRVRLPQDFFFCVQYKPSLRNYLREISLKPPQAVIQADSEKTGRPGAALPHMPDSGDREACRDGRPRLNTCLQDFANAAPY